MSCVADRVLGEILGDDPEHPGTERQIDPGVALGPKLDARPDRRALELLDDLLEHGQRVRVAERDDLLAALELREEEDLVDQRAGVLHLGPGVVEERGHVGARVGRSSRAGRGSGERGAQLVRDGRREPGAELVERDVVGLFCGAGLTVPAPPLLRARARGPCG